MSLAWRELWGCAPAPSASFCLWHGWWSSWISDSTAPWQPECRPIPRHGVRDEAGVTVRVPPHPLWECSSWLRLWCPRAAGTRCWGWRGRQWGLVSERLGRTGWGALVRRPPLPVPRMGILPRNPERCSPPGGRTDGRRLTKQDDAATVRNVGSEVQGLLKVLHSLVKIDYILVQAAAVQVGLHKSRYWWRELQKSSNVIRKTIGKVQSVSFLINVLEMTEQKREKYQQNSLEQKQ